MRLINYSPRYIKRAQDITPTTLHRVGGLASGTEPSQYRQTRDYKSVFFWALNIRAKKKAEAITKSWVMRYIGQQEFEPVEDDHPWVQLLRSPNPDYPGVDIWTWSSLSVDLSGHADFWVERNGAGVPVYLYPIWKAFGRMRPVPDQSGGIASWEFYRNDGQRTPVPRGDVLRIARKDPTNPYETISLIQAARLELDVHDSMKKYRADSVEEGGINSTMFKSDQHISKEDADRYGQRIKKYMGRKAIGDTLILGKNLEPVKHGMSSRDLEYVNGEIQTWEQVEHITGIMPGMFSKDANRAVSETAERTFVQYTINPELESETEQIRFGLELMFGADSGVLHIEYPDTSPIDKEQQRRDRESYIMTGQRTIDELRRADGWEEYPESMGEKPLINGSLMPLEQVMSRPESVAAVEESRAKEDPWEGTEWENRDLELLWRAVDSRKDREKRRLQSTARAMYDDMKDMVMEKLSGQRNRQTVEDIGIDDLFDQTEAKRNISRKASPELLRTIRRGFETGSINMAIDVTFNQDSQIVQKALQDTVARTQNIAQTTRDQLARVVTQAVDEGKTTDELATMLESTFNDIKNNRSHVVAQTMGNQSFEAGQSASFETAGITSRKWLSQRDGVVRDAHQTADGQTSEVGGTFTVGGYELKYPGDPMGPPEQTINCRCSQLPVKS